MLIFMFRMCNILFLGIFFAFYRPFFYHLFLQACGFPDYWKIVLFRAADGDKHGFITLQSFSSMIKRLLNCKFILVCTPY